MNSIISNNSQMLEVLTEEVRVMTLLARLLDLEQNALVNNTPIQLEELTTEKNTLLGLLGELAMERMSVFNKMNVTDQDGGIQQYFENINTPENIKASWKELLSLSNSAQEKNKTNGLLINRQLNLNQSKLNILQNTDTNESMYGADGQSKAKPASTRGYVVG